VGHGGGAGELGLPAGDQGPEHPVARNAPFLDTGLIGESSVIGAEESYM
jgi:hypothetical protein